MRESLIKAVRAIMDESHSSYFMRWEIRDDGHDMAQDVAEMFVDQLIIPALGKAHPVLRVQESRP